MNGIELAATILTFLVLSISPQHQQHSVAVKPAPKHHRAGHGRCHTKACFDRVWLKEHPAPPPEEWAIPSAIVRCESNYSNEPPNSAGAAGYYQLTEWTSKSAGLPVGHYGYANEHTKAEQGIVAGHLYREQGSAPWVSSEPCWGG